MRPIPGLLAVPQTPGSATSQVPASELEEVGTTRAGFGAQTRQQLQQPCKPLPGSGPSGWGGHLGALGVAVPEEPPA